MWKEYLIQLQHILNSKCQIKKHNKLNLTTEQTELILVNKQVHT